MILRQQIRTLASLLLAVSLSLWAEAGAAATPLAGHGPECHAHSAPASHVAMAAMPEKMAAGCCPGHATSKRGCPSHPAVSLAPTERPDCCAMNDGPERPAAFLVTSSPTLHHYTNAAITVTPELALSPAAEMHVDSPPGARPILDQKADLRI